MIPPLTSSSIEPLRLRKPFSWPSITCIVPWSSMAAMSSWCLPGRKRWTEQTPGFDQHIRKCGLLFIWMKKKMRGFYIIYSLTCSKNSQLFSRGISRKKTSTYLERNILKEQHTHPERSPLRASEDSLIFPWNWNNEVGRKGTLESLFFLHTEKLARVSKEKGPPIKKWHMCFLVAGSEHGVEIPLCFRGTIVEIQVELLFSNRCLFSGMLTKIKGKSWHLIQTLPCFSGWMVLRL